MNTLNDEWFMKRAALEEGMAVEAGGESADRKVPTENGDRAHDQHCAWCDCEEFVAVRYGSLHHLSERAARAVKAVVAVVDNPHCPECGSPEKRGGCVTCADGW